MKRTFFSAGAFLAAVLAGCGLNPIENSDLYLDGKDLIDTSLTPAGEEFRVSTHPRLNSTVDPLDRNKPVVICVHGYGASTFEWVDFRDYVLDHDTLVYTSLVLMGGHGGKVVDFMESTWEDWQAPVMEEYDTLVELGFHDLSFAGSSTGCTVILELLSRNVFNSQPVKPRWFFFIDPIIVPSNKLLTMVDFVGPIIGNSPLTGQTPVEMRHWYHNRPAETLDQLYELTELVRDRLESGFRLPAGAKAKVYKSTTDNSADPVGALLIYKGLTDAQGNKIEVEMVDSDLHVFTRLSGRASCTAADTLLQQRVFGEMVAKVRGE
jgi:carboxylesterase